MRTIFLITPRQAWEKAKPTGYFETESLETEGFIHLSRPQQILRTAEKYFKGQSDLVLLQVYQEHVHAPVKYEGKDNNNLFPHIYGKLNNDAVIGVYEFKETSQGFTLPPEFQLIRDTLIRLGIPGDEAEIASCHTHAWQQSYKGIVPDEILDARPLSFRNRLSWWKSIVEKKTSAAVFVAESAQHGIVGFCSIEPARDKEFNGYGEIGAIYCLNEYKNKGIGAALLRRSQKYLAGQDMPSSYLWVLRDNPTIQFYERMGGVRCNKEKVIELGKPLTEIAFEWKAEG